MHAVLATSTKVSIYTAHLTAMWFCPEHEAGKETQCVCLCVCVRVCACMRVRAFVRVCVGVCLCVHVLVCVLECACTWVCRQDINVKRNCIVYYGTLFNIQKQSKAVKYKSNRTNTAIARRRTTERLTQ